MPAASAARRPRKRTIKDPSLLPYDTAQDCHVLFRAGLPIDDVARFLAVAPAVVEELRRIWDWVGQ